MDDSPLSRHRLSFSSQALTILAIRTGILVMGLLTIPDAIAVIPRYTTPAGWILGVTGIWISGMVLWFVGFLGLSHAIQFIQGGLSFDRKGVKLGRLDRFTPWSEVRAISIEEEPVFEKLTGLRGVRRLQVFHSRNAGGPWFHKDAPSFIFAPAEFEKFCTLLVEQFQIEKEKSAENCESLANSHGDPRAAFSNRSYGALGYHTQDLGKLRRTSKIMRSCKVLTTMLILFSLCGFLGRKALVNYTYNLANRDLARGQLELALQGYTQVTTIDPTFAQGWHNLATTEFGLDRAGDAEKHWSKAVFLKPDMVEPKVRLAYLNLQRRQFDQARILLEHACRRAPEYRPAQFKLAEYYLRVGDAGQAVEVCRQIIAQKESTTARCFIAEAQLARGHAEDAMTTLDTLIQILPGSDENYHYLLTRARTLTALGHFDGAQEYLDQAASRFPVSTDLVLARGELELQRGHCKKASAIFEEAKSSEPQNPWVWIALAQVMLSEGDEVKAAEALKTAFDLPSQDLLALSKIRELSERMGMHDLVKQATVATFTLEKKLDEPTTASDQMHYWINLGKAAQGG